MEEMCRQRARQVLEELKISKPPVDVEEIAKLLGLKVEYVHKGKGFHGQLSEERKLIQVQQDFSPHHARMTIAHQIGHHVLNHKPLFCYFDESVEDDPRKMNEKLAQIFAHELLMPEPWIEKYWSELERDLKKMARAFYVSKEAMHRRLEDAELLTQEPSRGGIMAVARVTTIVSSSPKSWQDAAEQGFKRARRTLRGITGLRISDQTAHVEGGKIVEYRVRMLVTFVLDE